MAFQPHPFPTNSLGLQRGTVLEALDEIVWQIGMKIGDRIFLGFDGTDVRFGSFDWSIDQLVNEIERGVWKVVGQVDLSNEDASLEFARKVELLQI
jgi:hypothetical protein